MTTPATTKDAVREPEPEPAAPAEDVGVPARRVWGLYALGMVLLAALTFVLGRDEYVAGLLATGLLFAGLASAWNIIGGFGGQFSLGHGVFFAIGAYALILLQVRSGWSPWLALVVGTVLAAAAGALLAWPLFRLRGPFFAIGTLALNEVALALANYFDFTGGAQGVRIPFADQAFLERGAWTWIMFVYMAAVVAIAQLVLRSRLGHQLVAVREEEDAADASGANPLAVKTWGLVLSAGLTGLGGGLFAMYIAFIDPPTVLSIADIGARIPLLALIGGLGTIAGPVIGALLLQPGELFLRGELSGAPPGISLVVLGVVFVLAARFFRRGVWGSLTTFVRRRRARAR